MMTTSHPAPPPPGVPPLVSPKSSPGDKSSKKRLPKSGKTTRSDEKPSTTISTEPDMRGSVFSSTRPRYNLRQRKWQDNAKSSLSWLPPIDSPPEGPSPELESGDDESLYATDGDTHLRSRLPSADPLNISKLLIKAIQMETPNTYKQVMCLPLKQKWQDTMQEECNSLIEMGTWILVAPPKHNNVIENKWVFVVKADSHYKAQLVAKGFTQKHGIDCEETFSPMTRYKSIWVLTGTCRPWRLGNWGNGCQNGVPLWQA